MTTNGDSNQKRLAAVVAGVLLLAYLVTIAMAWSAADEDAERWSRIVVLLGGLEALAFAATGWLFGRDVSREALEQATSRVDEAEERASSATSEAKQSRSDAVAAATALRGFGSEGRSPRGGERNVSATAPGRSEEVQPAVGLADQILRRYGVIGD